MNFLAYKMIAEIIGDARENKAANVYLPVLVESFNANYARDIGTMNLIIKSIETGDYVISIYVNNVKVIACVIERKTWQDLYASLVDSRMTIQEQKMRQLRDTTGADIIYIIEGPDHSEETAIGNTTYRGLNALLGYKAIRGMKYIRSKDKANTALIVCRWAEYYMKLTASGELRFEKQLLSQRDYLLSQLSQISLSDPELTTALDRFRDEIRGRPAEPENAAVQLVPVDKLLKTRRAPGRSEVLINMWKTFPGVGDILANTIHNTIDFVDFARDPDAGLEIISKLVNPGNGRSIPKKTVTELGKIRDPEMQEKLLLQVPGIGDGKAKKILAVYEFADVITGRLSPEALRCESKKIGKLAIAGLKLVHTPVTPQ